MTAQVESGEIRKLRTANSIISDRLREPLISPTRQLDGDRPGRANESGRLSAWAAARRDVRANVGARSGARALLSIDVGTHAGLRDRALIVLMVYSFDAAVPRNNEARPRWTFRSAIISR